MGAAMHPRISVSAMCSAQWSLDEDLSCYERLGVSQVGLSFEKLLGAAGGNLDRVREQVATRIGAAGLRVTNMLGLGVQPGRARDVAGPAGAPASRRRSRRGDRG